MVRSSNLLYKSVCLVFSTQELTYVHGVRFCSPEEAQTLAQKLDKMICKYINVIQMI